MGRVHALEELSEASLQPALSFLCEVFPPDAEEIRESVRGALDDHDRYCDRWSLHRVRRFVLKNQDELIALTGYYASDADTAWLSWFAVRGDLRSQQIGKRLLGQTIQIVQQDGYKELHVWTGLDNIRAIMFYQREGFRPYLVTEQEDCPALLLKQRIVRPSLSEFLFAAEEPPV